MQIRYAILNLIRAWKKTLVFFLLLSVVTAAVTLAAGICQTAKDFLRQCRESYVTIVRFQYDQTNCGADGYDPAVWEAAEQLRLPESVLLWDPARTAAGSIKGLARTDTGAFGSDAAVVVVRISSYDSHLGIYSATVSETLYSRVDRTDQMVYVIYDGELEQNHKYLIHGSWFRGYSGIINLGVAGFTQPEALAAGFDGSAASMILDVTDNTAGRERFEILADYYRETSGFVTVTATADLEALYPFQQSQLILAQGEGFRAGDGKVCVVSDLLAESMNWQVGDTVELSLCIPRESGLYESYWPETGFDAVEVFTIVGLFESTADHRYEVYIPSDSVAVMAEARCGSLLGQARIPSDKAEGFSVELPDGVRMTVLDQGYAYAAAPFRDILRSAALVLAGCLALGMAVLLLFGYLFVWRQRDVLRNMIRLGVGPMDRQCYFLTGSGLLALAAALCGIIVAAAASGRVETYLADLLSSYSAADLRYSSSNLSVVRETVMMPSIANWVFPAVGGSMWLCAIAVCLAFAQQGKTSGRRDSGRHHRGRSRSLAGGSWKFAWLSVLRGGGKTWTPLCAVFFGILLLGYLPYAEVRYGEQLSALRQQTQLLGYLTNDNAQLSDNISVNAQHLRMLDSSGVVEDLTVTKNYHYLVSEGTITMPKNEYEMDTLTKKILSGPALVSTNYLPLCPEFRYTHMTSRWLEGYSEADLQLRELDTEWVGPYYAAASEGFLRRHGYGLGDTVELWYTTEDGDGAPATVMLIGAYSLERDRQNLYVELGFSFGPGWKTYIDRWKAYGRDLLGRISFHSAAFRCSAADLPAIKDTLEELGFSQPGRFDRERRWIVLEDREYLDREAAMARRMRYMELLFPVVYGIVETLALAASWMLMLHHRRNLAVMRAQGASQMTAFFSVFWNQLILCLSGRAAAVLLMCLLRAWTETGFRLTTVFLALWLTGSAAAAAVLNRREIVSVLKAAE